jgi:hypothetical protein
MVGRSATLSPDQIMVWETRPPVKRKGALRLIEQHDETFLFDVIYANRAERRADSGFEKKAEFQPAFDVCFADGNPFSEYSVKAKLHEIANQVDEIATSLITAYLN